ncbi:hypothetical protein BG015_000341, partial [Linnemannia schmuckeri]
NWILQSCAPGTACTSRGCDFIQGPVKSCLEVENERKAELIMRNQMRDAIDLMWGGMFGNVVDTTWDSYADFDYEDEDDSEENAPAAAADNDRQDDASQQQHQLPQQQGQEQQKPFTFPDRIADTQAKLSKAKDTSDDYLIDFVALEAGQDFMSFSLDPTEASDESIKTFRTQVRIRTNGDAINSLWRISFFVKPGETVKSVSRGTFVQNGPRVFITSKPKEEAHKSMVIRFVIEGVRTVDPLGKGIDVGTTLPDSNNQKQPDLFAPHDLPDPAFARFETKAIKL